MKILYSIFAGICLAVCLATPATSFAQTCTNQVGINVWEYQASRTFISQSGWVQNALPGALYFGQIRKGKFWNIHTKTFEDVLPYVSLLDSCIGGGATNFTEVSTIPMFGVVQYRVVLVPVDTTEMYTRISTFIKLPWVQHTSARMVEVDGDFPETNFTGLFDQVLQIAGNGGHSISIQNPYEIPYTVCVTDLSGRVIATSHVDGGTFTFSADDVSAGMYLFNFSIEDDYAGSVTRKVILQ